VNAPPSSSPASAPRRREWQGSRQPAAHRAMPSHPGDRSCRTRACFAQVILASQFASRRRNASERRRSTTSLAGPAGRYRACRGFPSGGGRGSRRRAVGQDRRDIRGNERPLLSRGVRQFLDIGTGLPAAGAVHEVAQQSAPQSRVVYADNDPLVVTHAHALLSDEGVVTIQGTFPALRPSWSIRTSRRCFTLRNPSA
jgi:hypothetical protein